MATNEPASPTTSATLLSDRTDAATWLLELNGMCVVTGCPVVASAASTRGGHGLDAGTFISDGCAAVYEMEQLARVEWERVDAVLLFGFEHSVGLPFVTEYTGFKGRVLGTEPCAEFA
ncbi:hypothetical protein HK405_014865, partial [Cladochytrium tenue]